jgi:hypothetical protein
MVLFRPRLRVSSKVFQVVFFNLFYNSALGNADGGTVVNALCYKRKVAGSIPDGVIEFFH